jgi:hypothetical protein
MERPPRRSLLVVPLWLGFFLGFFALAMLVMLPLAIVQDSEWTLYAFGILFGLGFALFCTRRWRRTIIESDANGYTFRIERKQRASATGSGGVAPSESDTSV